MVSLDASIGDDVGTLLDASWVLAWAMVLGLDLAHHRVLDSATALPLNYLWV